MKKLLVGLVAAGAMAFAVPAAADQIETPIGTVSVNEGDYVLVADGNSTNPGPGAGFISVSDDPQVCADDNGTADDGDSETGDPETGADSSSPSCAP